MLFPLSYSRQGVSSSSDPGGSPPHAAPLTHPGLGPLPPQLLSGGVLILMDRACRHSNQTYSVTVGNDDGGVGGGGSWLVLIGVALMRSIAARIPTSIASLQQRGQRHGHKTRMRTPNVIHRHGVAIRCTHPHLLGCINHACRHRGGVLTNISDYMHVGHYWDLGGK